MTLLLVHAGGGSDGGGAGVIAGGDGSRDTVMEDAYDGGGCRCYGVVGRCWWRCGGGNTR